ncbi:hypothetical protein L6164_011295 [Bauhinia variegata]|uniref:Uncharacterized protein n=1 Tax=Bauhinia variegata TaxID=167791 RepID=A0ACB9P5V3_BAUVA|nr:hypothetical protein L6164_011295 [Bauhinia variegata]
MESSQIFGAAEECHSNDSGWTMYIGSSIDDDGYTHEANPEDDSDDSMASDASSGPSLQRNNPWGNCEGGHGHGLPDFQQAAAQEEKEDEFDDDDKYSLANKSKEKKIAEKKVEKKEVLVIDNNKGKAPAHSGGKVRINQNHRLGKRK